MAWIRQKENGHHYYVTSVREGASVRQKVLMYLGEHETLEDAYFHHDFYMWYWYEEHNRTSDKEKKRLYMSYSAYHREYADPLREYIRKETGYRPPSCGPHGPS